MLPGDPQGCRRDPHDSDDAWDSDSERAARGEDLDSDYDDMNYDLHEGRGHGGSDHNALYSVWAASDASNDAVDEVAEPGSPVNDGQTHLEGEPESGGVVDGATTDGAELQDNPDQGEGGEHQNGLEEQNFDTIADKDQETETHNSDSTNRPQESVVQKKSSSNTVPQSPSSSEQCLDPGHTGTDKVPQSSNVTFSARQCGDSGQGDTDQVTDVSNITCSANQCGDSGQRNTDQATQQSNITCIVKECGDSGHTDIDQVTKSSSTTCSTKQCGDSGQGDTAQVPQASHLKESRCVECKKTFHNPMVLTRHNLIYHRNRCRPAKSIYRKGRF